MKTMALVGIVALFVSGALGAQVRGTVVDEMNTPIENASVVAMQVQDSVFVGNEMTDSCGRFVLDRAAEPSEILLRVQAVGYEGLDTIVDNPSVLTLALKNQSITMEEVSVSASPSFNLRDGKLIFTPGRLSQIVNNGFVLLNYIPTVMVNRREETVELIGRRSVKLLINGKEPVGGNFGAIKALQTTRASRIRRVEIDMAPSFRYSEYSSVVNIVMDPKTGYVFFGKVNNSFYKDQYAGNQQIYLAAEYDRWQYMASLNANENSDLTSYNFDYRFHDSGSASGGNASAEYTTSRLRTHSTSFTPSVGVNIDLQHNNYLSLYAMTMVDKTSETSGRSTEYFPQSNTNIFKNINNVPWHPWGSTSLSYNHKMDDKGSKLMAKIGFFFSNYNYNTDYYGDTDLTGKEYFKRQNSVQFKSEWDKVLSSSVSVKFGADAYRDWQKHRMLYSDTQLSDGELSLTDKFRYVQSHVGLSAGASWSVTPALSLDLGVEGQWYNRNCTQYIDPMHFDYNKFYLLPNAYASWRIDSRNFLIVTYKMDVLQPYYNDVNPIEVWFSDTHYSRGNPELKPQNRQSLSWVLLFMNAITIGGNHLFSRNISSWGTVVEEDNILCNTPLEIGRQIETNIFLSSQKNFFDYRWSVKGEIDFYHRKYSEYGLPASYGLGTLNSSQWVFTLNNTLVAGRRREWMITLDFRSESPKVSAFSRKGWKTDMNFEISREFRWGGKVYAGVYNIFDSRPAAWFDCGEYFRRTENTASARRIMLRFDITVGKQFSQRQMNGIQGMGGN